MDDAARGSSLLGIARNAIARALGETRQSIVQEAWLNEWGATFVTLTLHGQLRGCIGSLEAHRPLFEDVNSNAVAAAFRDPRFPSVSPEEFGEILIEVSLLSPVQPMSFASEQDALAQLRPGVDGVIFEYDHYRSTFLPQVWEQLPQPHQFMAQLKRKAGLPDNFWADGVKLSRYTVTKYREEHH